MVVVFLMVVQKRELGMGFIGMIIIHGERERSLHSLFLSFSFRNVSARLEGNQTNQRAELAVRKPIK